jgi:hypothetical protein
LLRLYEIGDPREIAAGIAQIANTGEREMEAGTRSGRVADVVKQETHADTALGANRA